ncbi:hypothetical protein [Nocardia sp. NPDC057030]|uniref:hypothetical protein n=1 Tax=unclassified Nocardia TaxID=2637762 RepID=UPI0036424353
MTEKVVVVDHVPTFRAGLSAVLEQGGFEVARPDSTLSWIRRNQIDAAVVTIHTKGTHPLRELVAAFPDLVVLAVLLSPGIADFRDALRAGAHAAVQWDSHPDDIVQMVRSAIAGQALLPTPIVRSLANSSLEGPDRDTIGPDEIRWLRALAQGTSVVRLARNEGYSQRETFRRLADIYRRMGVRNRHEAIALAGQWGMLVPAAEPPTITELGRRHRAQVRPEGPAAILRGIS